MYAKDIGDSVKTAPWTPGDLSAPLRLNLLARRGADNLWQPVICDNATDGTAYQGVMLDAAGRIHEWVEIWVQKASVLGTLPSSLASCLTNARLDDRWRRLARCWQKDSSTTLIETGWETEHSAPLYFDTVEGCTAHPGGGTQLWRLCGDDALLAKHQLPSYSGSLCRYLFSEDSGNTSFLPVTGNAAGGPTVCDVSAVIPSTWLPLNAEGGLVMVRRSFPVDLERMSDYLAGAVEVEVSGERGLQSLLAGHPASGQFDNIKSRFFSSRHGPTALLKETIHLKTGLICSAVQLVRKRLETTGCPLLNLQTSSFRIRLPDNASQVPALWAMAMELASAGAATVVDLPDSSEQIYLRLDESNVAPYHPAASDLLQRGSGTVRLRDVKKETNGRYVIEGTLTTPNPASGWTAGDLVCLRLSAGGREINVHARLQGEVEQALGEWRFRTLSVSLPQTVGETLRAGAGVKNEGVSFEVYPEWGPACDLYALGVLAVRVLLTTSARELPAALDDLLALAHICERDENATEPLPTLIGRAFAKDQQRWQDRLGPLRGVRCGTKDPRDALRTVTSPIWFGLLASVIRMLTGASSFATFRHMGDLPSGNLASALDIALGDLQRHVLLTQSLVMPDHALNQEIAAVIQRAKNTR